MMSLRCDETDRSVTFEDPFIAEVIDDLQRVTHSLEVGDQYTIQGFV